MTDLLAGNIQAVFASAPTAVPQIKGDKLRGLAVTGAKREASLPDVPTMAEQGFEKYQATNWYGFIAPARTPADIIQKLAGDDLHRARQIAEIHIGASTRKRVRRTPAFVAASYIELRQNNRFFFVR